MQALSRELEAWQSGGRMLPVFGREVFVRTEGPENAEPLLVLHGFPTSSFDFRHVTTSLARHFRVVLHDHVGFGLSEKPEDFSYSLIEQAEIALGVWRKLGIRRGHILAHDYGTSIATELLARRDRDLLPFEVSSLTFCNGSVFIELSHLRPGQQLLRLPLLGDLFVRVSNEWSFRMQMRELWGDAARADDDELRLLWEGIRHREGHHRLPQIIRYVDERFRFRSRWIPPLGRLDLPVHVLWGHRDPVAVPAIAEALARLVPNARLTWLDELGHYPMLEDPDAWSREALGFLVPIHGAQAARRDDRFTFS